MSRRVFEINYLHRFFVFNSCICYSGVGNWLQGKVMEVDCSLAKMFYLTRERQEWIYRGSSRLRPLYKEFKAAKYRMQTGHRGRIVAGSVGVSIIKTKSQILIRYQSG